ncbi:hypothetical protein V8C35DRAFT_51216 [Trichoderma chlorosporum]
MLVLLWNRENEPLFFFSSFSFFPFFTLCLLSHLLLCFSDSVDLLSPLRGCAAPSALGLMPALRPRVDLGHMYPLINSPPCSRLSGVYRVPVPGSLARKHGANCRSKLSKMERVQGFVSSTDRQAHGFVMPLRTLRERLRIYRLDTISQSLGRHTGRGLWHWLATGTPCFRAWLGRKDIIANFNIDSSLSLSFTVRSTNSRHS